MTIKEIRDIETNKLTGYNLDGMFVPIDSVNRHYKEIKKAIKDGVEIEPAYTKEERLNYFKNKKIQELKKERDDNISKVVITLSNGISLNGNKNSRIEFSSTINSLSDTDTIKWIDYNNKDVLLNKDLLKEALVLTINKHTEIIIAYNSNRQQVLIANTVCDIYPELKECEGAK